MSAAAVDPLDVLLPRLERVRKFGTGWRADCPVGHTSRGALSIATADDGRVLLRCFACGEIGPVLAALNLQVADLFPRRDVANLPPMERARIRELAGIAQWRAALGVLATEATVVEVAATIIGRGDPLAQSDVDRVHAASQRIHDARAALR